MLTNDKTDLVNEPAETLTSGLTPETKKVIAVATGIAVASAGVGLATGTVYSEEIKENVGKVEEAISGSSASNAAETPVATPAENIVSISHSMTDADGVIHTVELIDCDADSIADDVTITQLEPDGAYITMGGDLNLLNPVFYEQTHENSMQGRRYVFLCHSGVVNNWNGYSNCKQFYHPRRLLYAKVEACQSGIRSCIVYS